VDQESSQKGLRAKDGELAHRRSGDRGIEVCDIEYHETSNPDKEIRLRSYED
jgi:hypothetical protein